MATKFIAPPLTYTPGPVPNITVAYIAGPAAAAANDAIGKLPEADETLDDVALRSAAQLVVSTAQDDLSPALHAMFLDWLEAAAECERACEGDDGQGNWSADHARLIERLVRHPAIRVQDLALQAYLEHLEILVAPTPGPLSLGEADHAFNGDGFLSRMAARSPLPRLIEDMSRIAWDQSPTRTRWSNTVAAVVLEVVREARDAQPDCQWRQLQDAYEAARREEIRLREHHSERESLWLTARKDTEQAPKQPDPGPLDTSVPLDQILAQSNSSEWKACWASYEQAKEEWEAQSQRLYQEIMGEADRAWQAALDVQSTVVSKIKDYPALSLAMLSEKASILKSHFDELDADDADALIRDIRHLAERVG